MAEITQAELKRIMDYNPETGIFRRKVKTANRHTIGEIVSADCGHGYLRATINNKQYYVHRLAWLYVYGDMPSAIDHINHVGTDNRISNLRECSQLNNLKNRRLSSRNKTGVHGVYRRNDYNAWSSEIRDSGKKINLGTYKDFFDAICARKSAEIQFNYHTNHGAN